MLPLPSILRAMAKGSFPGLLIELDRMLTEISSAALFLPKITRLLIRAALLAVSPESESMVTSASTVPESMLCPSLSKGVPNRSNSPVSRKLLGTCVPTTRAWSTGFSSGPVELSEHPINNPANNKMAVLYKIAEYLIMGVPFFECIKFILLIFIAEVTAIMLYVTAFKKRSFCCGNFSFNHPDEFFDYEMKPKRGGLIDCIIL